MKGGNQKHLDYFELSRQRRRSWGVNVKKFERPPEKESKKKKHLSVRAGEWEDAETGLKKKNRREGDE